MGVSAVGKPFLGPINASSRPNPRFQSVRCCRSNSPAQGASGRRVSGADLARNPRQSFKTTMLRRTMTSSDPTFNTNIGVRVESRASGSTMLELALSIVAFLAERICIVGIVGKMVTIPFGATVPPWFFR
jgi:hypothetical protein